MRLLYEAVFGFSSFPIRAALSPLRLWLPKSAGAGGGETVAFTDSLGRTVLLPEDITCVAPSGADAIVWAVSVGLIQGTDGSTLTVNPTGQISRAEVCTMLQRYYTKLAK